ncbi:hypothetical protein NPIL_392431 [Nephila pilipes]|uniref:Uncharacterized protein n=1 Tax=Nephila pilipes TaxID=299642 RepID=A0A8X6N849_NEPPI|nr:hypothetical protein NPIL_392431 [Nephila pilipes]
MIIVMIFEVKPEFVPPQGTTTVTETPYKRNDQTATVPVVRSFVLFKMCQALDLPATFVPEQRDVTVYRKKIQTNQPVPIVYSVAVFEMCKALELKAKLAHQEDFLPENYGIFFKPSESCDYLAGGVSARELWRFSKNTEFCDNLAGGLAALNLGTIFNLQI